VHPFYLWLITPTDLKTNLQLNIATFVAKAIEENG